MGGMKPGNRKNALAQMITAAGSVHSKISSPSMRLGEFRGDREPSATFSPMSAIGDSFRR